MQPEQFLYPDHEVMWKTHFSTKFSMPILSLSRKPVLVGGLTIIGTRLCCSLSVIPLHIVVVVVVVVVVIIIIVVVVVVVVVELLLWSNVEFFRALSLCFVSFILCCGCIG